MFCIHFVLIVLMNLHITVILSSCNNNFL